ncbi:hypothetical protein JGU66_18765 [Myxococcaceae bacterium JPH2]|nr:hypothetical protein [Myxococcaceae bacterium JPH2]
MAGEGGLKVGDLYVVVTTSVGEAIANLGKLVKSVEKAAKQVKEASKDIGEIGMVVAAGIAAAVAAAAQSNEKLKKEITRLRDLLYTVVAEIGDMFRPLVKQLTDGVSRLVARFQALSPELKQHAAQWATWVAGAGLAIGAVGKLAGVVEGLAKGAGLAIQVTGSLIETMKGLGPVLNTVGPAAAKAAQSFQSLMRADIGSSLAKLSIKQTFASFGAGLKAAGTAIADFAKATPSAMQSIGKMLGSFGSALVPILAVAAALAAITLLVGSLYRGWGDLRVIAGDAAAAMTRGIGKVMGVVADLGKKVWGVFTTMFEGITSVIRALVEKQLDFIAYLVSGSARLLAPVARAAKMRDTEAALAAAGKLTGQDLAAGLGSVGVKAANVIGVATAKMESAAGPVGSAITDALKAGAQDFVDTTKTIGGAVFDYQFGWMKGDGLKYAIDGVKQLGAAIGESTGLAKLSAMQLEDVGEPGKPRIRYSEGRQTEVDAERDKKEHGRNLSYAQLQAYQDEDMARQMRRAEEAESAAFSAAMTRYASEEQHDHELAELTADASEEARAELTAAMRSATDAGESAFRTMRDEAAAFADAAEQALEDAKNGFMQKVVGSLGRLGQVINSAVEGFQAGGIWGAVIGAVAELFLGSKQFQDLIAMTNAVIGDLSDGLGALASGAQTLVGAVKPIIDVVMGVLKPLLDAIGRSIEPLLKPIAMVALLLQGLQPVLTLLIEGLMKTMKPLMWLNEVVIRGLFETIRYVGIAILWVVKGIGGLWNGIIGAIQSVFKALGDISVFGAHPLGFLKGWANSLGKVKVDTESLAKAIQEMEHLSWSAALAKAQETAEVLKNTDALQAATEALSNVPSAWRVALRRFDAEDPEERGGQGSSGTSGVSVPGAGIPTQADIDRATGGVPGEHGASPITGNTTVGVGSLQVNIHGTDIDDAMQRAQDLAGRLGFEWARRAIGGAQRLGPRYGTP